MRPDRTDEPSGAETGSVVGTSYTMELRLNADGSWFARIPDLPGCMTEGASAAHALGQLEDAKMAWVATAVEDGVPIPPPRDDDDFSGRFVVRVPRTLHRDLVGTARREGVSLNTLVVAALGKFLGAQ
jgi:antitoxin HicB